MSEAIVAPGRRVAAMDGAAPDGARGSDEFGVAGDIGSAFVLALAALIAVVVVLGSTGIRPLLVGGAGTATTTGFFVVLVSAFVWLRRGARAKLSQGWWVNVLPASPALVLVGYALVVRSFPVGTRAGWFLGGDHVRHTVMVAEEQSVGMLSYATYAYPRGLHTLVAALWSTAGVEPRSDFAAAIDLAAAAVWLLSAGLALATSALAATLARRSGLQLRAAALSGAAAGLLTFLTWFLGDYQALGFQTSLLGALTLAVVLRSQLVRPCEVRALVIAAAGLVVLAHTWQLLLPAVAIAAIRSGIGVWRSRGVRGLGLGAGLAVVVAGVGWPAMTAVVTQVGLQHATDAGVDVHTPWVVLALGVGAASFMAPRLSWQGRGVLALMGLPALTGLALAAWLGITPGTYYPSKLIWHTAALLLAPIAVVVVASAIHVAEARDMSARVVRICAAPVILVGAVYLLVQPAAAFVGVWSKVDGAMLLRLVQTPDATQAQVVWSGRGEATDTLSRTFLDAVRAGPGPITTPQEPLTVDDECALLETAEAPTVLTAMPERDARERYSCVPSLTVIAVE